MKDYQETYYDEELPDIGEDYGEFPLDQYIGNDFNDYEGEEVEKPSQLKEKRIGVVERIEKEITVPKITQSNYSKEDEAFKLFKELLEKSSLKENMFERDVNRDITSTELAAKLYKTMVNISSSGGIVARQNIRNMIQDPKMGTHLLESYTDYYHTLEKTSDLMDIPLSALVNVTSDRTAAIFVKDKENFTREINAWRHDSSTFITQWITKNQADMDYIYENSGTKNTFAPVPVLQRMSETDEIYMPYINERGIMEYGSDHEKMYDAKINIGRYNVKKLAASLGRKPKSAPGDITALQVSIGLAGESVNEEITETWQNNFYTNGSYQEGLRRLEILIANGKINLENTLKSSSEDFAKTVSTDFLKFKTGIHFSSVYGSARGSRNILFSDCATWESNNYATGVANFCYAYRPNDTNRFLTIPTTFMTYINYGFKDEKGEIRTSLSVNRNSQGWLTTQKSQDKTGELDLKFSWTVVDRVARFFRQKENANYDMFTCDELLKDDYIINCFTHMCRNQSFKRKTEPRATGKTVRLYFQCYNAAQSVFHIIDGYLKRCKIDFANTVDLSNSSPVNASYSNIFKRFDTAILKGTSTVARFSDNMFVVEDGNYYSLDVIKCDSSHDWRNQFSLYKAVVNILFATEWERKVFIYLGYIMFVKTKDKNTFYADQGDNVLIYRTSLMGSGWRLTKFLNHLLTGAIQYLMSINNYSYFKKGQKTFSDDFVKVCQSVGLRFDIKFSYNHENKLPRSVNYVYPFDLLGWDAVNVNTHSSHLEDAVLKPVLAKDRGLKALVTSKLPELGALEKDGKLRKKVEVNGFTLESIYVSIVDMLKLVKYKTLYEICFSEHGPGWTSYFTNLTAAIAKTAVPIISKIMIEAKGNPEFAVGLQKIFDQLKLDYHVIEQLYVYYLPFLKYDNEIMRGFAGDYGQSFSLLMGSAAVGLILSREAQTKGLPLAMYSDGIGDFLNLVESDRQYSMSTLVTKLQTSTQPKNERAPFVKYIQGKTLFMPFSDYKMSEIKPREYYIEKGNQNIESLLSLKKITEEKQRTGYQKLLSLTNVTRQIMGMVMKTIPSWDHKASQIILQKMSGILKLIFYTPQNFQLNVKSMELTETVQEQLQKFSISIMEWIAKEFDNRVSDKKFALMNDTTTLNFVKQQIKDQEIDFVMTHGAVNSMSSIVVNLDSLNFTVNPPQWGITTFRALMREYLQMMVNIFITLADRHCSKILFQRQSIESIEKRKDDESEIVDGDLYEIPSYQGYMKMWSALNNLEVDTQDLREQEIQRVVYAFKEKNIDFMNTIQEMDKFVPVPHTIMIRSLDKFATSSAKISFEYGKATTVIAQKLEIPFVFRVHTGGNTGALINEDLLFETIKNLDNYEIGIIFLLNQSTKLELKLPFYRMWILYIYDTVFHTKHMKDFLHKVKDYMSKNNDYEKKGKVTRQSYVTKDPTTNYLSKLVTKWIALKVDGGVQMGIDNGFDYEEEGAVLIAEELPPLPEDPYAKIAVDKLEVKGLFANIENKGRFGQFRRLVGSQRLVEGVHVININDPSEVAKIVLFAIGNKVVPAYPLSDNQFIKAVMSGYKSETQREHFLRTGKDLFAKATKSTVKFENTGIEDEIENEFIKLLNSDYIEVYYEKEKLARETTKAFDEVQTIVTKVRKQEGIIRRGKSPTFSEKMAMQRKKLEQESKTVRGQGYGMIKYEKTSPTKRVLRSSSGYESVKEFYLCSEENKWGFSVIKNAYNSKILGFIFEGLAKDSARYVTESDYTFDDEVHDLAKNHCSKNCVQHIIIDYSTYDCVVCSLYLLFNFNISNPHEKSVFLGHEHETFTFFLSRFTREKWTKNVPNINCITQMLNLIQQNGDYVPKIVKKKYNTECVFLTWDPSMQFLYNKLVTYFPYASESEKCLNEDDIDKIMESERVDCFKSVIFCDTGDYDHEDTETLIIDGGIDPIDSDRLYLLPFDYTVEELARNFRAFVKDGRCANEADTFNMKQFKKNCAKKIYEVRNIEKLDKMGNYVFEEKENKKKNSLRDQIFAASTQILFPPGADTSIKIQETGRGTLNKNIINP